MKFPGFSERFIWACAQDKKAPSTHRELGKYFRVSGTSIGYYERGEKLPSTETGVRIATKTGVSFDYLMTGRGSKYPVESDGSSIEPLTQVNLNAAEFAIEAIGTHLDKKDRETMPARTQACQKPFS